MRNGRRMGWLNILDKFRLERQGCRWAQVGQGSNEGHGVFHKTTTGHRGQLPGYRQTHSRVPLTRGLWSWLGRVSAIALVAGLLTGCDAWMLDLVNHPRVAVGAPALVRDPYLDGAAAAKAQEMCVAGTVATSPNPAKRYGGITSAAVHELVGAAALDPSVTDPVQREVLATRAISSGWNADPVVAQPRWDSIGIGQSVCGDRLIMAAALRDAPSMRVSGRFVTSVYAVGEVTRTNGLVYGTAKNYQGKTTSLLLDVYRPPAGPSPSRPLVVLIHGGGFVNGSRSDMATDATLYAQAGFVVASIDYRLQPQSTSAQQLTAASNGIDDGMEAVRWLKASASTYGIDTTRIVLVGSSAGGVIALGAALLDDPTPAGPLSALSPVPAAAVSTGAHLTPANDLGLLTIGATDAPVLMYHNATDSVTGSTSDYAFQTCSAVRVGGGACDFVINPGSGHTIGIGPDDNDWRPTLGPFVWQRLRLAALPQ